MRAVLFATSMVLLSSPLWGQTYSADYTKCAGAANTQMEINQCAGDEFKRADGELNRVYQALLQARRNDPSATSKTRAAQRAWIAFRDAHMQEAFPAANKQAYGSMYPTEFALEEAWVTSQRVALLQNLLNPKDNPH